jgi:hypothetical protein
VFRDGRAEKVGGCGVGSGSGWVVVTPIERSDQCGHFGGKIM